MPKVKAKICIYMILGAGLATACAESTPETTCTTKVECADIPACAGDVCRCVAGVCQVDACKNGVLDSSEADVDCGQACGVLCSVGQKCKTADDCTLHACSDGICVDEEASCVGAATGDLRITEIMTQPGDQKRFENLAAMQREFIEIANVSDKKVSLRPITIQCVQVEDRKKSVSIPISGCIQPLSAIVISKETIEGLPNDAVSMTGLSGDDVFLDSAEYECSILQDSNGTASTIHVARAGGMSAGTSAAMSYSSYLENLSTTQYTEGVYSRLVSHVDLNKKPNSPGYCSNGARYQDKCDNFCSDQKKSPGESDIDCGGPLCSPCEIGKKCSNSNDCASTRCSNDVCIVQHCAISRCPAGEFCDQESGNCYSCHDGIKNGEETDIDCGGSQCDRCPSAKACDSKYDCKSLNCDQNVCTGPEITCEAPIDGSLIISEVFNYIDSTSSLTMHKPSGFHEQVEYIEIANLADKWIDLSNARIKVERIDDIEGTFDIPLTGCVAPKQAIVISGSKIPGLPDGVDNLSGMIKTSNALVNTALYSYTLMLDNAEISVVYDADPSIKAISKSASLNTSITDPKLKDHNVLNPKLTNSPGYCTNGALFVDGCDTFCANGHIDSGETDIDCGGSLCDPCDNEKKCEKASDCKSANCLSSKTCGGCGSDSDCSGGKCDLATGTCYSCSDNVANGNESDVDCGGDLCGKCGLGQTCKVNTDCESENCKSGKCDEPLCKSSADCGGNTCNAQGLCETCNDGLKNQNESDEDCGGRCDKCELGQHCNSSNDCKSGVCDQGVCASCNDGIKNQDEIDIDCGGVCGLCSLGKYCDSDFDCKSQTCSDDKMCIGEDLKCAVPVAGNIVISEVFNFVSATTQMTMYTPNSTQKQVEFIELVNTADHPVDLSGVTLYAQSQTSDKSSKTLNLRGCLESNQALVLSGSPIADLPNDVLNDPTQLEESNALTNTHLFKYSLKRGNTILFSSKDTEVPKSQISMVVSNPYDVQSDASTQYHNVVNAALKHSPGYCTNGNLYKNRCEKLCSNTIDQCGGECDPCQLGTSCSSDEDCESKFCADSVCKEPVCSPQTPCDAGKACSADTDCKSGLCDPDTHTCLSDVHHLVINEVMARVTGATLILNNEIDACEFIELVNMSDHDIDLTDKRIRWTQNNESKSDISLSKSTSNIVKSKNAVVVYKCPSGSTFADLDPNTGEFVNMSDDVVLVSGLPSLTDTATFTFTVVDANNNAGPTYTVSAAPSASKTNPATSMNRAEDLGRSTELNTPHKNISEALASPGLCSNKARFSNNCIQQRY